jgi:hypothetical protein
MYIACYHVLCNHRHHRHHRASSDPIRHQDRGANIGTIIFGQAAAAPQSCAAKKRSTATRTPTGQTAFGPFCMRTEHGTSHARKQRDPVRGGSTSDTGPAGRLQGRFGDGPLPDNLNIQPTRKSEFCGCRLVSVNQRRASTSVRPRGAHDCGLPEPRRQGDRSYHECVGSEAAMARSFDSAIADSST